MCCMKNKPQGHVFQTQDSLDRHLCAGRVKASNLLFLINSASGLTWLTFR